MRVGRGARWMAEGKARLSLLSIGLAFDARSIMPFELPRQQGAVYDASHDTSRHVDVQASRLCGNCGAPSVCSPFPVNDA
jgi:hypothetical protein